MRIDSSGNMGIGTSSPTGRLTVSGSSGSNLDVLVGVNSSTAVTDGKSVGVLLRGSDTSGTLKDAGAIRSVPTSETYSNASLAFSSRSGDTLSERMRITSAGDVGIGTSSPAAKLEVVSGTGTSFVGTFRTGDATAANNAGGGFWCTSSATAANRDASLWLDADGANFGGGDYFWLQKLGNNGVVNLIQASSAAMTFQTAATERMRIASGGNVGIGTTSPAGKLDIRGGNGDQLFLDNTGQTYTQQYFRNNGNNQAAIWASTTDFSLYTYSTQPIIFHTNTTERMRISSAGYTGVNTTSPRALFNVQNGNIISETTSRGSEVVNASAVSSTGETNATTGWSVSGLGISGMSSVGTDNGITPQNGSFQLKLTGVNNGERVDYGFSVVAGKRYQVSFYANKYQGQYYFLVYVSNTNSGDNYGSWFSDDVNNLPIAITAAGWNQYTITFSAPTSGTYYLSMRMATGSSPSTITYIDNMSIKEITGSVSTGGNISGYNVFAGGTLSASTIVTGSGVAFPATQSASANANTLDDYEEGTWTPADTSGAG